MSVIFCYSNTGNSLYAAKKIAQEINATVLPMTNTNYIDDDVIGFVFPVFYWGLPKHVENFVKNLDIKNKNAYIFSVSTYGGFTLGEQSYLKKILKQKNRRLCYFAKVKAVENYIPSYRVNNNIKIHDATDKKLDKVIKDIKNKKKTKFIETMFNHKTILTIISHSVYPKKCGESDKNFSISSSCNGCGICKKICPAHNIEIKDSKPQFLHNCDHCLSCIHACPKTAINYRNKTYNKERYLNPNIKLDELIKLND